jgi:hypothetical protein
VAGADVPGEGEKPMDEEPVAGGELEIPEEPAERVRAVVVRVVEALGLRASVDI